MQLPCSSQGEPEPIITWNKVTHLPGAAAAHPLFPGLFTAGGGLLTIESKAELVTFRILLADSPDPWLPSQEGRRPFFGFSVLFALSLIQKHLVVFKHEQVVYHELCPWGRGTAVPHVPPVLVIPQRSLRPHRLATFARPRPEPRGHLARPTCSFLLLPPPGASSFLGLAQLSGPSPHTGCSALCLPYHGACAMGLPLRGPQPSILENPKELSLLSSSSMDLCKPIRQAHATKLVLE